MKTYKIVIRFIALLICGAPLTLSAQQDPMVSQYMFSGHFLNPAYAGSHPYANITLLGRKQWVGFNGSPITSFLSFDTPLLNRKLGVGALLSYDNIGVTQRTQFSGTFSYHLQLGYKARLAGGISMGIQHYTARLSKLTVWDQNDQVFTSDINGKILPVAGAGLYFYTERFYTGLSIPNALSYKQETFLYVGNEEQPKLQRHYYGTIGYAIPAGKNLDVKPSLLAKYAAGAPVSIDYNLQLFFYKVLWVGASYRGGDGMVGLVEYQATRNLRVGYAYDFALTNLRHHNSGSHEIMLAWDFRKEDNLLHKSIRFF